MTLKKKSQLLVLVEEKKKGFGSIGSYIKKGILAMK